MSEEYRYSSREDRFHCEALNCYKSFANAADKAQHWVTEHTPTSENEKYFSCGINGCKEIFVHEAARKAHWGGVHDFYPPTKEEVAAENRAIYDEIADTQDFVCFDREDDPVNHPSHYTSHPSGIECIEVTRHYNFNIGNAIKYLWRQGLKDSAPQTQDLEKAIWYIKDEIEKINHGTVQ